LPQAYQTGLILRGDRRILTQGVEHQPRVCAQHAARVGVESRLMPRELAASVLPALELMHIQISYMDITHYFLTFFFFNISQFSYDHGAFRVIM
jgi:hypothetical protein